MGSPLNQRNGPPVSFNPQGREPISEVVRQEQRGQLMAEVGQTLLQPALLSADASQALWKRLEREEDPTVRSETEAILRGLCDPRPARGELPTPELNRYLDYSEIEKKDGTKVSVYRIKPVIVEEDLASLEKLKGRYPDLSAEITAVQNSLRSYARRDDRMVARDTYRANQDSYTSQALGQMGKTAGLVGAAFAATLAGGIMLVNMWKSKSLKEISFVPFFYGGIALLLAKKDVRDSVFGPKLSSALAPVDTVLNKSGFTTMAKHYNMEGKPWRHVIESCMREDKPRDDLLKKIKDKTATPADIDTHIASITTDPATQNTLRGMVANGDYEKLVNIFKDVRGPEATDAIGDYVENGTWKFAPTK